MTGKIPRPAFTFTAVPGTLGETRPLNPLRLPDPRAQPVPAARNLPDGPAPAAGPPPSASFLLDLGLTCAALGELDEAADAFRQAVTLKPGFGAAWRALARVLSLTGDAGGARAAMQADTGADAARRARPAAAGKIGVARQLLAQKLAGLPSAVPFLRLHLKGAPCDVAALCLLAETLARARHHLAAERLLERAIELAPHYPAARHQYAAVLQAQGKNVQALPHLEWLLAQDPRDVKYRTLMAVSLGDIGDYSRALSYYEGLSAEFAHKPQLLMQYAHALTYSGKRAAAVAAYRRCQAIAPDLGTAWWSLANLKNEPFSRDDVRAMHDALAQEVMPVPGRISVHFALGLALEQQADYAESFVHYARGAALKRSITTYDGDAWSRDMRDTAAFFSQSFMSGMEGAGCPDPAPIFILGMPRAGSTLIEQILSSHSAVEGTQELPEIGHIVSDIGGGLRLPPEALYPRRLASLAADEIAAMGRRYMDRSMAYRRTARPFFIDKMPTNWAYAGLIHLILPNAKIIDARRAPMASCFSAFKQLFGYGAEYSYDLSDLAKYYRDYVATMAHFDAVLPGRIHRVSYENMVEDTETETRRLLAYCGLPFEPGCLRFWENTRAISTASAEQVRRPIFKNALEQWRNYEPWLGPLAMGLTAAGR